MEAETSTGAAEAAGVTEHAIGESQEAEEHRDELPMTDPLEAERRDLVAEREQIVKLRDGVNTALRNAARARRDTEADLAAEEGRKSAEQTRIEFEQSEAQRAAELAEADGRPGVQASAIARHDALRKQLANQDVALANQQTETRRRIASLTADMEDRQGELVQLDEKLSEVMQRLDRLDGDRQAARGRELEERLEALAPVVEAQREVIGVSGTQDLSKDYVTQAEAHSRAWKVWGVALVVIAAITAACGLLLFAHDKVPKGEVTGPTIVDLVRNLFVIGLLLYGVRMASLQFRVHRHMEAVARNKAAALATFNRIVAVASEKEVRNSLAVVLAQAVFSSDETGFIESGQDQITLIERLAAAAPRFG